MSADPIQRDVFDARVARAADGLLATFNAAGVLAAADVHVARTLGRLCGEASPDVLLAAALAVRAPRLGHVCVNLTTIQRTATVDNDAPVDVAGLPWPALPGWTDALAASPLATADGPLRLAGPLLYLDRYWREEQTVAAEVRARAGAPAATVDERVLADGLNRLFGEARTALQRAAAEAAVRRRFTIVAGGPGTGKTTTVARILALLDEQAAAAGVEPPRVALAAPTGKAAARLEEAVHEAARTMGVPAHVRDRLLGLEAATLHRLLGWRPGHRTRFTHDRGNRLAHDVVIVDETSMVSLSLMARLLEAVRPDARLVLVGDPEQLASVEAGAVLGDLVAPGSAIADGVVVLRHVYRYGGGIAELAHAVQDGDGDAAMAVLGAGRDDVAWIDADVASDGWSAALAPVRAAVVDAGRRVVAAARAGDGRAALAALATMRVLCAHRRGPYGVARWLGQIQSWLAAELDGFAGRGEWYPGRPLLVTENDYGLGLYNGDTGVVVAAGDDRVAAVFERRGELLRVSPAILSSVETVHAMTIHKSQGSQFASVAVLLPAPDSPILTRELLYTAVTRAQRHLTVVGTEAAVRAAVARPVARASGLRAALSAP